MTQVMFNFGTAIELCKQGIPVRNTLWRFDEFIVPTNAQLVTADKFWNEHNKKAAENNGGYLLVKSYIMRTDSGSTVPFVVTNDDIYGRWVKASTTTRVLQTEYWEVEGQRMLRATYGYVPEEEANQIKPFWLLYENLDLTNDEIVIISPCSRAANTISLLVEGLIEKYIHGTEYATHSVATDVPTIGIERYVFSRVESDLAFLTHLDSVVEYHSTNSVKLPQFIVDQDSLVGLVDVDGNDLYEVISKHLMKLGVRWTPISFQQETGEPLNV